MSASDVGPMASFNGASASGGSASGGSASGGGPDAYHSAEMASGKWSDAYSFLGDTFSAEKGYDPIQRNFQSLLGPGPVGGPSAATSSSAPAEKRSPKEDALLKDFEAYSKARDRDVTGPPKRQ